MILRTLKPVLRVDFNEIVVVLGSHAEEMRIILRDYPVRIVENRNWEEGQSTSLSAGVHAISSSSDRVCLLLGDQPFLRTETLQGLIAESDEHPEEIIVPFFEEKRGNPIIVPSRFYALLLELTKGDMGGKKLLETVGFHKLMVDDPGILRDIDTIEELKKYVG